MQLEKLDQYLKTQSQIEGWFQPGAAQIFALIDHIQKASGIKGNIFEIGVHHGRSTVLLGMMTSPTEAETLGICDLFDRQEQNITGSGKGNKNIFIENFISYCGGLDLLTIHEKSSKELTLNDIGNHYRFFHIDGGHSADETYSDLHLASQAIEQNGVIVVDDYFNQQWPGVSEGVCRFLTENLNKLVPLVVGYNKLLLCNHSKQNWYQERLMQDGWRHYVADPRVKTKLIHFFGVDTLVYYVPATTRKKSLYQRAMAKIKGGVVLQKLREVVGQKASAR